MPNNSQTAQLATCPRTPTDEPQTGNRTRAGRSDAPVLVWRQLSRWSWETECGRFRIERFTVAEHERIQEDYVPPSRYRILKRSAEWDYEFSPNEGSLNEAQDACQKYITVKSL